MKIKSCALLIAGFLMLGIYSPLNAQLLEWWNFPGHPIGGTVVVRQITEDPSGNSISLIQFREGLMLDSITIPGSFATEFVVVKRNAAGTVQWWRKIWSSNYVGCAAVCTDSSGNAYVGGSYNSNDTVRLDSTSTAFTNLPIKPESSSYILKYNSSGTLQWAKTIDGQYSTQWQVSAALNMMRTNGNTLFVATLIDGVVDFDMGSGNHNVGLGGSTGHAAIASYDFNGNLMWANMFGSYNHWITNVCFTSSQDIIIAGTLTTSNTDLDPGPGNALFSPVGQSDIFVTKLNSFGGYEWTRQTFGNNNQEAISVTLVNDTNILLCATTNATMDIDPTLSGTLTVTCTSGTSKFFALYGSNSNFISGSAILMGPDPYTIFVTSTDHIVYVGYSPWNSGAYYICFFDLAYNLISANSFGGGFPGVSMVFADLCANDKLYITGSCEGNNDYGNDGTQDIWVVNPYYYGMSVRYYVGWGPESIEESARSGSIQLYPNPAADECYVQATIPHGETAVVYITDINGKELWKQEATAAELGNLPLKTATLPNGIYTVSCATGSFTSTEKLVIAR